MPFRYASEFRRQICARMLDGESVRGLAAELSISDATRCRWPLRRGPLSLGPVIHSDHGIDVLELFEPRLGTANPPARYRSRPGGRHLYSVQLALTLTVSVEVANRAVAPGYVHWNLWRVGTQ
jgi:hypothetical protein